MQRTYFGTHLWLAGTTGLRDEHDKVVAIDFDAQTRQCFRNMESKLALGGAKLSDLVTMTVFINDPRHGPRFLQLRKEILKKEFPASALITVSGFADPRILIEIQAVAVIDS
jgi:2-iminobutanoate/2-iminopropanoate deaminase